MTIKEFIRKKILKLIGLNRDTSPDKERLTFISDNERLIKSRIREYNTWYGGDGDELLNLYTRGNMFEFHAEPYQSRNKKNYFWSISSTESDIKRTHSGQPRNIIDTLVMITKFPTIKIGEKEEQEKLNCILNDCKLKNIYKNEQLPLTLVEGWGCYKINFDKDITNYPYPVYYRAENVDFVYKAGRIVGVIFRDYYTDGGTKNYILVETRSLKFDEEKNERVLVIQKELYSANKDGEYINTEITNCADLPEEIAELKPEELYMEISNMNSLLAVPCILFQNTSGTGGYGRSIFTGKIDLFDDLDQCLSQASNAVRKSTPTEYFDVEFLERDKRTGMPVQPKAFDRKYVFYKGQVGSDGEGSAKSPVQVTQPNLDFEQYSNQAIKILMQIINGIMSPATLGIDIAKKDNAEAQREKEKVTIFTRNAIIESEHDIINDVCQELLRAYELMHTGKITKQKYDITIKFSEFADDSYENKLEVLGKAFDNELISEEMYMDKLYGDTLSDKEYEKELNWLIENHTKPKQQAMGNMIQGQNAPQPNEEEDFGDEEL